MKGALKVGTILGIPIHIHFTFLLILPIFAFAFGAQSEKVLGFQLGFGGVDLSPYGAQADLVRYGLGTMAAVIFFACVLLHELGHSVVALRYRVRIRAIVLMIFGGVSQMEEIPRQPARELRVAVAGPLVSLAIAAVAYGLFKLPLGSSLPWELLGILLGIVAFYNLSLGLFNLVPAFPMDGGRILRATLARGMGYLQATEAAVAVGKAFAFAFAVVGVFINPWLILIALFVYFGAGEEERLTRVSLTLEGVRVRDLMNREISSVPRAMTAMELLDKMLSEKHLGFPVVEGGRLVGIVAFQDVSRVPPDQRALVTVGQVMNPNVVTVGPDETAMRVLNLLSQHQIGRVVVVEGEKLLGILTRSDLIKSVEVLGALRSLEGTMAAGSAPATVARDAPRTP